MRFALILACLFIARGAIAQDTDVGTDGDRDSIAKAATRFVDAYNQRDARSLAALFAENAEVTHRDGVRLTGRAAIGKSFEDAFALNPRAKISLEVQQLRFITDDVAVEEGRTLWFPDGESATMESTYRVAHIKRGGQWKIASVRTIDDEVLSNYEYLRDLQWLLGDWIDEGRDSVVETNFRWTDNRAYLIREFQVKTQGATVLKGTQRIGWDSRRKQFRSWTFDSEGGFVEGYWTAVGSGYVIRSSGYLKDGSSVSGTTRFDREGDDKISWAMFNRLRGQEVMPDVTINIVRKPPAPNASKE